ncbi:hypothetical protein ACFQDE_04000 [Deinococcus caeni]|uniref:hypothetical protein n=1 Tax=Deinococcus caeni TaxID=569127 RepID=UPI0036211F42
MSVSHPAPSLPDVPSDPAAQPAFVVAALYQFRAVADPAGLRGRLLAHGEAGGCAAR